MNPSAMKNTPESNEIQQNNLKGSLDFKNQPCLTDLCKEDQTLLLENNSTLVTNINLVAKEKGEPFTDKNVTKFKLLIEKEVLENPDFSDGDIPKETQKQLEIMDKLGDLMNIEKKEFIKKIHNLSEGELEDLLMANQILNGKNPSRLKDRIILDRIEDIQYLYDIKTSNGDIHLGTNEDNLPTDENGNKISVADMWPEGIPEELNN